MKIKLEWFKNQFGTNYILNNNKGKVYLSFQENKISHSVDSASYLDSANPETAIVLIGDKLNGENRFLIFRGDRRDELKKLYPNITKLKSYWKKHGGHFFSDDLKD